MRASLCLAVKPSCHGEGTHLLLREHINHPDSLNQAEGACSEAWQRMEGSRFPPPSPKAGSKLCRGKKNNARNYSGWQVNKLALITIWVSKPSFSHARQLYLSNHFAPAVFIPALGGWSSVQHPMGGTTPRVPGRGSPLCSHGTLLRQQEAQWGHLQGQRCLFRDQNGAGGCNGRALPRLPGSGL